MRAKLLALLLILCSTILSAQEKETEKADELYQMEAFSDAVEAYKEAYVKEINASQKARIIFQIAESYRQMNQIKDAQSWYDKSIRAKHTNPLQYYYLAQCLMQSEKYQEAIEKFEEAKKADVKLSEIADRGIKGCQNAMAWKKDPTRYVVANENIINSSGSDFAPAFLDKRNSIVIFTSSRQGSSGDKQDVRTGENFQDLWVAERDRKGKWSEPYKFAAEINTEANEGSAKLDYKRGVIYFTRCLAEKKEKTYCDVLKASYVGGRVSGIQSIGLKEAGAKYSVGQPALSKKEDVIVFVSDMEGGQGGNDLWAITYDKKAKAWSKPKNLGPKINTPGEEVFPYVHADGRLFYSTDGLAGMGGLDIYVAEEIGEARWGNPENLKVPINSSADDYGIIFNKLKNEGFFSSNRKDPLGRGGDDVYSFFYPPLLFVLQGKIFDKDQKAPVEGVTVEIVGSDGNAKSVITGADGLYKFEGNDFQREIQENTSYSITVSKQDYLISRDKITTVGKEESTTFVKDFLIQYSPPNKAITLPEIRYETAKWNLLPASKDSLNFLFDILTNNPNITIELKAHTDSRGDDESNLVLSQKRAQSCVDYLISKGIAADRMVAKGYGETDLKVSDETIDAMSSEADKQEAHAKNRRTEFEITSTTYTPKGK